MTKFSISRNSRLLQTTGWAENIAGKGENAGDQHFLLFPKYFQRLSFPGCENSGMSG